jgi:UDP-glucose 4-epimerase
VLQVLEAFGRAAGRPIPYRIAEKRPGDVATNFADPSKALRELDWAAKLDLDAMCEDTWRWQSANPNGYDQPS